MTREIRRLVINSLERNRARERWFVTLSRAIWPWRDEWLVPLAALLAALDLLSTYVLLELSQKTGVDEGGLLARWVLQRGGFNGLYVMNAVAVIALCLMATGARVFYTRVGLPGFARAAYVISLVPYTLAAFAAVVNNLILSIL